MTDRTPRTKRECFERVVAELNLDTRDPFTLLFANACALADRCDQLKGELAAQRGEGVVMRALLKAAINLSDELNNAEHNGITLPAYVDNAWLHLSVEIEKCRSALAAAQGEGK